jgi:hypothetical protein
MRRRVICLALLLMCCAMTNKAQTPLKIYISADMEGVVGVVTN